MDTIFSSDEVHARDRFDYWHQVACREVVQHHSRPDDLVHFYARLSAAALDDIAMLQIEMAPTVMERDEQHVARADHDDYLLCLQSGGVLKFQGVNDVTLEAGQATILDPSQIYLARAEKNCRMVVARLPRRDLETRMGSASHLVLRELDTSNAELVLATKLLQSAMDEPTRSESGTAILRDAVLDLLAIALSDQLQGKARVSSTRERTLISIRRAIQRNISDPNFSVRDAAESAGVSVRYANVLLSRQDTSLGRLIVSMRLEKCAAALGDPMQSHRSIQEIAFAWGFSDQSHFGKAFKNVFEVSPSEFRAARGRPRISSRSLGLRTGLSRR